MPPRCSPARLKAGLAVVLGMRAIAKQRDEALRLRIHACKARMQAKSRCAVAIVAALSAVDAEETTAPRRQVQRALGKWRGSTVGGYVNGDDQTYKVNFRCSRETFGLLHGLLLDTRFATAAETRPVWHAAQLSGLRKRYRTRVITAHKMTAIRDPPDLRFKLAACLYVFGQGGVLKPLADACSVGKSTLRGWLEQFSHAVIDVLKPLYMPARPFTAEERACVESEFAARRGIAATNGIRKWRQ